MKKLTALFIVLAFSLMLFGGCASNQTDNNTNELDGDSGAAADNEDGQRDELVIAFNNKIANYDPYSSTLAESNRLNSMLFDTVAAYTGFGSEIELRLATDYAVSEDGLSWTFNLRDDVVFHDGTPLTANDVKVSVEAIMASPYKGSSYENFESVEVTGDHQFILHTKTYDAETLGRFDGIWIVQGDLYTEQGAETYAQNLIGTGAFSLESQDPASGNMILKSNADYWDGEPQIKQIEIRYITEASTRIVALEKGEVDLLTTAYTTDYETLSQNSELQVSTYPASHSWSYLIFNTTQAPCDNRTFRQAIAYALDYETISLIATGGVGTVVNSVFFKEDYGYELPEVQTYTYDPEKAMELLSQAGITTPYDLGTVQVIGNQKTTLEYTQQNLAAVGINFEIEQVEGATYVNGLSGGNFIISYMPNASLGTTPATAYKSLFTTGDANNFSRYSNSEVDELVASMENRRDDSQMEEYVGRLVQIVQEDVPMVNLYHMSNILAADKDLHVELGGTNQYVFRDFYWK